MTHSSEREAAAADLAAAWTSWQVSGSVLDRMGTTEAVRLFRSHGPFIANMHTWANDTGCNVTGVTLGAPDTLPVLYRGAVPGGRDGMSWTDSMVFALQFAWDSDGQVFTCEFAPEDFLALVRITYEDHPGKTDYEWIMQPNGKASLWVPPWLHAPTPEAVAADHQRLKRDLERLIGPTGSAPLRR
jgi:hypothetical protein